MPTIEELQAQIEALATVIAAQQAALPDVVPNWGMRTCQQCGAEATMIDTSPATRVTAKNGEGYCNEHGTKAKVDKGEHIRRGRR